MLAEEGEGLRVDRCLLRKIEEVFSDCVCYDASEMRSSLFLCKRRSASDGSLVSGNAAHSHQR